MGDVHCLRPSSGLKYELAGSAIASSASIEPARVVIGPGNFLGATMGLDPVVLLAIREVEDIAALADRSMQLHRARPGVHCAVRLRQLR